MKLRSLAISISLLILLTGCITTYESELSNHEKRSAQGDKDATYHLALHYLGQYQIDEKFLQGHEEVDYKKSVYYLKILADKHHADATYLLATLYGLHYYIDDNNYLSTKSRCDSIDTINQTSSPFKKCYWTPTDEQKQMANSAYFSLIDKAAELGHTQALIQKSKDNPDCSIAVTALKQAAFKNGSLEAVMRLGIIYQSLMAGEYYSLQSALKMFSLVEKNVNQSTMSGIQLYHLAEQYTGSVKKILRDKHRAQANQELVDTPSNNLPNNCQYEFNNIPSLNRLLES